ncbi:LysE family transporter [Streptomyces sp. NPDC052020]|uniref:LysE family transporter n=1 Tax=Streptomyces sp. NPDC052020 TaxID=3155677 RepID=UPI0034130DE0
MVAEDVYGGSVVGDVMVAGLLAGYGIAMPVGAITVLIITLSAQTSLRTGFSGAMGTATADGLYALLAATTGTVLAGVIRPVADPMRWAAAVVLVVIAAKGILAALRHSKSTEAVRSIDGRSPFRAYWQLLGLTILNPLTVIYFSALVLGLRNDSWTASDSVVFVIAAFIASASWQAVLAIGGALIGRVLNTEKGRIITAVVGNGVILFLAGRLLFS